MDDFYTGTKAGYQPGWHFLQLPGPTNIPQRILNATAVPAIDHRSMQFAEFGLELLQDIRKVFKTKNEVFIYPSTGTGAWEAAIVNTLSAGDEVLMHDTGMFSRLWVNMANKFGLKVTKIENDWRSGPDPKAVGEVLAADKDHNIKAVMIVHNETSTGTTTQLAEIRKQMDAAGHPALLLVDTISSLGSIDFRFDEWGVDVAIGGSQKGLMMPPGLSFNAVSDKAREASKSAKLPRCFFDWEWMRTNNKDGFFPYTPAINLLFGLREALQMLGEEGFDNVLDRHSRLASATRLAVKHWGLETVCQNPLEYSNSVTTVFMPEGHSADAMRTSVLKNHNMALGSGLAQLADKVIRIGHMGHCNDMQLAASLAAVEIGMMETGIPFNEGGAAAANEFLVVR